MRTNLSLFPCLLALVWSEDIPSRAVLVCFTGVSAVVHSCLNLYSYKVHLLQPLCPLSQRK